MGDEGGVNPPKVILNAFKGRRIFGAVFVIKVEGARRGFVEFWAIEVQIKLAKKVEMLEKEKKSHLRNKIKEAMKKDIK